jgi:hypothetical protein
VGVVEDDILALGRFLLRGWFGDERWESKR